MHKIPAFPGLLRPGSTAIFAPHIRNMYGGKAGGVVFMAGNVAALVTCLEDCRPALIPLGELSLDLSDATGRLHARLWLAEQGHETQEDRAEVLAWSVESVRRGGKPLQVLPAWEKQPSFGMDYHVRETDGRMVGRAHYQHWWVGQAPKFQGITALLHGEGYDDGQWTATGTADWEHDNDWQCGQRACDAALLALGWALTDPDGSLTLPPLPEVQNG